VSYSKIQKMVTKDQNRYLFHHLQIELNQSAVSANPNPIGVRPNINFCAATFTQKFTTFPVNFNGSRELYEFERLRQP